MLILKPPDRLVISAQRFFWKEDASNPMIICGFAARFSFIAEHGAWRRISKIHRHSIAPFIDLHCGYHQAIVQTLSVVLFLGRNAGSARIYSIRASGM
ncbi:MULTISPECIES: hypothetical protein [unclassified Novosphingobium]|uniref:hypothetical protein n=1 Tax=unclassified Novosphingobium TaxID=2644732 RepID=UPI00146CA38D|nr:MULTISPECIES: hypothetical protein [unclassified Novosphingobium]NMN89139.1 hypothetical protein [Novosphingobium sp. SG916]